MLGIGYNSRAVCTNIMVVTEMDFEQAPWAMLGIYHTYYKDQAEQQYRHPCL